MALSTSFIAFLAAPAAGQAAVFVGGGATIPIGDFGDIAKTGWTVNGGLTFSVSPTVGIWVEGRYDGAKDTQHITIEGGLNFRIGTR